MRASSGRASRTHRRRSRSSRLSTWDQERSRGVAVVMARVAPPWRGGLRMPDSGHDDIVFNVFRQLIYAHATRGSVKTSSEASKGTLGWNRGRRGRARRVNSVFSGRCRQPSGAKLVRNPEFPYALNRSQTALNSRAAVASRNRVAAPPSPPMRPSCWIDACRAPLPLL